MIRTFIFLLSFFGLTEVDAQVSENFYSADHADFQYTGRIDFSNPKLPRYWSGGVYVEARFIGTFCEIEWNDELLWGNSKNYLAASVDGKNPVRFQSTGKFNSYLIDNLAPGEHTIVISKETEAIIGFIEFKGIRCQKLLSVKQRSKRKIEFYGDSITSGMGNYTKEIPCDSGVWYDQHSAWFSYGAQTARTLNAKYQLTSESGIGLIHSCCNKPILMPQVFDKMDISRDTLRWDFSRFQPDVVTICLGQNDGVQDSIQFTTAYIKFIKDLRKKYPSAQLICLTSPMADATLKPVLERYVTAVVQQMKGLGENRIASFSFSKAFIHGCGNHPDVEDHVKLSQELTIYISRLMNWK
jgi:lysophospholipase L1-like esterase